MSKALILAVFVVALAGTSMAGDGDAIVQPARPATEQAKPGKKDCAFVRFFAHTVGGNLKKFAGHMEKDVGGGLKAGAGKIERAFTGKKKAPGFPPEHPPGHENGALNSK
jgi:hypothetical protein